MPRRRGDGRGRTAGGQTAAIDFRGLRGNQAPDGQGNTIPLTLDRGQIGWSVRGAENKVLSARSEQISFAGGLASTYACANCCPNTTTSVRVIPEDEEVEVGEQIPYSTDEFVQNCYSQAFGPFLADDADWTSYNSNIATVAWSGLADGISIGDTSIQGCIDRTIWYHFGGGYCDPAPNRICNLAPVGVQCPPFSTNYPNAFPTNFRIKPGFPTTPGNGVLYFEYKWDSSDGVVDHLYACEIRECTRYGNTTCEQATTSVYPVPSPPYRANMGIVDPTRNSGGSAAYFYMFDRHRVPGTTEGNPVPEFRTPYVANSFTGMQKYQFKCPCNNGAVWTDLTPNINIVRTVSEANGIWTYTLTKSGSSVSYTLP